MQNPTKEKRLVDVRRVPQAVANRCQEQPSNQASLLFISTYSPFWVLVMLKVMWSKGKPITLGHRLKWCRKECGWLFPETENISFQLLVFSNAIHISSLLHHPRRGVGSYRGQVVDMLRKWWRYVQDTSTGLGCATCWCCAQSPRYSDINVFPQLLTCLDMSWHVLTCLDMSWHVLTCPDIPKLGWDPWEVFSALKNLAIHHSKPKSWILPPVPLEKRRTSIVPTQSRWPLRSTRPSDQQVIHDELQRLGIAHQIVQNLWTPAPAWRGHFSIIAGKLMSIQICGISNIIGCNLYPL